VSGVWNAVSNLSAGTLVIYQHPVAGDFIIGNLTQILGSVTAVTITPDTGKSTGTRTVYYEGTGGTTYAKSVTLPTAAGTYNVTFDVAATTTWNAANGFVAGILFIGIAPVVGDYDITGLSATYDGSEKAVTVTPKAGKSTGAVTVKYNGNAARPVDAGTYTVTFDVVAAGSYIAATGLSAGTLTINRGTPTAANFDISGLTQDYNGSARTVTITPKTGVGAVSNIQYNGSATAPSAAGGYPVTFDVAEGANYKAATGVSGGTMLISNTFTTIAAFNTWLSSQSNNSTATAYPVKLNNVSDLGGSSYSSGSLGSVLRANTLKYVSLDLSGSTFAVMPSSSSRGAFEDCSNLIGVILPSSVTSVGERAFRNCTNLPSITIPSGVTSIGSNAFLSCISLASVTFLGTIPSSGFDSTAFSDIGDLRTKFYATDATNGTPGTYTRTVPGSSSSTWTKQ